ncbi:ABC transporter substrate-binding protein [Staphylococcus chromogenes]|nr:ABC transporter substrate-binding protein [Staphylococcus chromogenes]
MKKLAALLVVAGSAVAGCGAPIGTSTNADKEAVSIHNCGEVKNLHKAKKLWAYDGSIIATALAAGAKDNLAYVSGIQRDRATLEAKYGDLSGLNEVTPQAPSLEELVSKQPELYFAGWGYGLGESSNVTPEALQNHGIESYVLSESCKQAGGARGTVDPWEAANTDIRNIAQLAGDPAAAERTILDIDQRRQALVAAPHADRRPNVFLFDSAKDAVFTSGKFGGPQAILDTAGARNATEDIADTWTTVGWETLAAENPDVIAFVDYPGQEFAEKVHILKTHPATKNLPAVKNDRFINLPYALWTSGPLNIDAAEHVRAALENYHLVPATGHKPQLALPADLAGREYLGRN